MVVILVVMVMREPQIVKKTTKIFLFTKCFSQPMVGRFFCSLVLSLRTSVQLFF